MNKKETKYVNQLLKKIDIYEIFFQAFNADMNDEFEDKKFENYILDFGKFENTPIIEMNSGEQLNYLFWYLTITNDDKEITRLRQYIFKWWLTVRDDYNGYIPPFDFSEINLN